MKNNHISKVWRLIVLLFISTFSITTYAADAVANGSFESGLSNTDWTLATTSSTLTDFPLCGPANACTAASVARTGDWHIWIGGFASGVTSSVTQTVTIPDTATDLILWVLRGICDDASDILHVSLDGTDIGTLACTTTDGAPVQQTYSVAGYNDGGAHVLSIGGTVGGTNGTHSNFFIDDVSIYYPDPDPDAIPTLQEWALIFLVLLLLTISLRLSKKRQIK